MNLGEPHPMLAVYSLCKDFAWNPAWLEDQTIKGKLFGVLPFEFTIPAISPLTIKLFLKIQQTLGAKVGKEKLK